MNLLMEASLLALTKSIYYSTLNRNALWEDVHSSSGRHPKFEQPGSISFYTIM